jgi:general stress protein YciG
MRQEDELIQQYLARIGSKGGKARAAKHDKATLSEWAKRGGRPKKGAQRKKRNREPVSGKGASRNEQ